MKQTLSVLSLLIMSGAACGQQTYNAKSLFFGEEGGVVAASTAAKPTMPTASPKMVAKKNVAPRQIGASYFIRLKRADGGTEDVLASRNFHSGDRFQLGVKVNRPTYVYVMNQDPEGKLTQIFPVNGQDNYVNAMGTVFLPSKGAFEFDAQPGVEQLLVFLSPNPMSGNVSDKLRSAKPDLVAGSGGTAEEARCDATAALTSAAPRAGDMRLAQGDGDSYASKGIAFKDDATPACMGAAPAYAAKSIVFSDDPAPVAGGQVATYVVKKAVAKIDKNLYLQLKLNHQ